MNEVMKFMNEERIIFFNKEIAHDSIVELCKHLLYLDQQNNFPITIYLDSPGGDIVAGKMLIDFFKLLKSDVVIIGMGLVASMASFILTCCPKKGNRKMLENSKYHLHQPLVRNISGNYSEIKEIVNELRKEYQFILKNYQSNSNMSYEEFENLLKKKDVFLTPSEALKYGLIDEII